MPALPGWISAKFVDSSGGGDGGTPFDDVTDDVEALESTDGRQVVGRTKFFFPWRRRRRRQIPHLPNPINVGLIASNRLSGRGRGHRGT